MRLEGWPQVRAVQPSFEKRAYGALLRMRLKARGPGTAVNSLAVPPTALKVGRAHKELTFAHPTMSQSERNPVGPHAT